MSEIGSGSGSSYPTSLDTDSTVEVNSPSASKTKARAEVINDLGACVVAVETTLGTSPQGTKADVKTFLQTQHNADGTHGNITTGTIVASGAVSGVTTLAVSGAVTGVTTLNTFPISATPGANTIPVSGSGNVLATGFDSTRPCFEATMSADQTISTGVAAKIHFDTKTFDTNTNYDAATNYRFTPTVAGKYLITITAGFQSTTTFGTVITLLYKNGSAYRCMESFVGPTTANYIGPPFITIADANGTTDYFEAWGYAASGGTITVSKLEGNTSTIKSYFSACRIGI